jgi:predicted metal-dependent HD superfamily phosphohydrolase
MTTGFFYIDRKDLALLTERWNTLTALYTTDDDLKGKSFALLKTRYCEEGRFYHNLSHIKALLDLFESLNQMTEDPNAIRFAIWFHDIIYNTRRDDNEEESAVLAVELLSELSVDSKTIDFVRQLILATKTNGDNNLSEDAKIFMDLDLSILGVPEAQYKEYSEAIKKEYSWVPGFLYRRGRKQILRTFIQRESIFFTVEMNERFEAQARTNITDELNAL